MIPWIPPRVSMAREIDDGYPGKCTAKASLLGKVPEIVPFSMIPIVTVNYKKQTDKSDATRWRIFS